jgi:hypothetical protein
MSGGGLVPSLSDVLDGKADAVLSHDPAANKVTKPVLRIRDPVPLLTPGSGMGKNSGFGSGLNNLDHISESLETIFWVKYLNSLILILDPEWKKFGSGIGDKHLGSATLIKAITVQVLSKAI